MYKILEKQVLSDVTKLVVVAAPHVARKAKAGQFVIVIATEQGERIPLTIADSDAVAGTITLIFQEVGKSTMEMGQFDVGDGFYSVAGPLGHPTEIENYGTVVCVAGGVGIAPMYPDRARPARRRQPRHLHHRRAHQGAPVLGRQDARGVRRADRLHR